MKLTIADFPQNHQERQVFDQAYDKGAGWILMMAFFVPSIPFVLFWWPLTDAVGLEGVALLSSIAQIASILVFPDRIRSARAHRALAQYRAAQPVGVELGGPTASFRPENYR